MVGRDVGADFDGEVGGREAAEAIEAEGAEGGGGVQVEAAGFGGAGAGGGEVE